MTNHRQLALSPGRARPSGSQGDTKDAMATRAATVLKSLNVIGQRRQHMPTEAARCHDVVAVTCRRRLDLQFVVVRIDHDRQRGGRRRQYFRITGAGQRALDESGLVARVRDVDRDGHPARFSYHPFAGGLWIELVHTSFKAQLTDWIADTLAGPG